MREWLARGDALDQADPLANLRSQFQLNEDEVYLDGNSLGALPSNVAAAIETVVATQWGQRQIRSWNERWIDLPRQVAAKIAPVIGAAQDDVICADSVSVNLYKLAAASLMESPDRRTIVSVKDMFPTDLYIAEGLAQLMGEDRCQLKLVDIDQLDQLDEQTNLVILSQVNFRTGEAYDVARLTQQIHKVGAKVIWDISHSAGVLPMNLEANEIDYAVGCGYKFLNGGPGAPAFLYVRRDLQDALQQPLSGWMGHKDPFAFNRAYEPAMGMDRLLAGTPNILSLGALDAAMDVYTSVAMPDLFAKAQGLCRFFLELVNEHPDISLQALSCPHRGAQVSLVHASAFGITQALIDRGVICDFRAPNLARFGFAPLYVSYRDVAQAATVLAEVMGDRSYTDPKYQQPSKVT